LYKSHKLGGKKRKNIRDLSQLVQKTKGEDRKKYEKEGRGFGNLKFHWKCGGKSRSGNGRRPGLKENPKKKGYKALA